MAFRGVDRDGNHKQKKGPIDRRGSERDREKEIRFPNNNDRRNNTNNSDRRNTNYDRNNRDDNYYRDGRDRKNSFRENDNYRGGKDRDNYGGKNRGKGGGKNRYANNSSSSSSSIKPTKGRRAFEDEDDLDRGK